MDNLTEHFTLIDILGMFLPGAMFVYALRFFFEWVTLPSLRFFGGSDATLLLYFVLLSYLCGMNLYFLGEMLEAGMWKMTCSALDGRRFKFHEAYWEEQKIKEAYQKEINEKLPETDRERAEAGWKIYRYVQVKSRPERVVMFSAFYSMGRTLAITYLAIALLVCRFAQASVAEVYLVLAVLFTISLVQWRSFEKRSIEEAYNVFANMN